MSEVPLYSAHSVGRCHASAYRGTSLTRNRPPPQDPTVGLCLGPYGGPGKLGVSHERGTPVQYTRLGTLSLLDGEDVVVCRGTSHMRKPPPPLGPP